MPSKTAEVIDNMYPVSNRSGQKETLAWQKEKPAELAIAIRNAFELHMLRDKSSWPKNLAHFHKYCR